MEPAPAACAKAVASNVTDESSSLSLVMRMREMAAGAIEDHVDAVPTEHDEGPTDVTTDSILRSLGIDPDVERAVTNIFAQSPSRDVHGETVSDDCVGINRSNPDTLGFAFNAQSDGVGSFASHNASVSATNRNVFATDDRTVSTELNGRTSSYSGLVLGPDLFRQ